MECREGNIVHSNNGERAWNILTHIYESAHYPDCNDVNEGENRRHLRTVLNELTRSSIPALRARFRNPEMPLVKPNTQLVQAITVPVEPIATRRYGKLTANVGYLLVPQLHDVFRDERAGGIPVHH